MFYGGVGVGVHTGTFLETAGVVVEVVILLKITEPVIHLRFHLQLLFSFYLDTWSFLKYSTKVGCCQLLPMTESDRSFQGFDDPQFLWHLVILCANAASH